MNEKLSPRVLVRSKYYDQYDDDWYVHYAARTQPGIVGTDHEDASEEIIGFATLPPRTDMPNEHTMRDFLEKLERKAEYIHLMPGVRSDE